MEYTVRNFWTDFDLFTNAMIRRMAKVNDEFGNPHMRKAIFDEVNELRRFTARKFYDLGIIDGSIASQVDSVSPRITT